MSKPDSKPEAPKPAKMDLTAFGAFYRPTGKGQVTRYGCPPGPRSIIGAVFNAAGGLDSIDARFVMALSQDEALRYSREYARAVREGALVKATPAEYEAFMRSQESGASKEK